MNMVQNLDTTVLYQVFGSFRFSPNGGKYILYQAEAPRHSNQNLFHESFEETQDIREPAIYLYDVAKVSFQRLRVEHTLRSQSGPF